MEIKFKLKESYYNETKNKEISIKSCMDREEREVGVNSVGDGQDREWVEVKKKVKGIGNVVLNTWKLHWISESK